MNEKMLEQMAQALEQSNKALSVLLKDRSNGDSHTKSPASGPTYTELHGNGSLFGSQSIERDVISAHIRPRGLASQLPLIPSVMENPRFGAISGYTDTTGSEAVNPCDDAPAGYMKAANLTAQFGRVMRDTQTIEIDKVMLRRNRGDFTDLMLRGKLLGLSGLTPTGLNESNVLDIATKSEMVIAAVNVERNLVKQIWQGTPSNNTAGGGYKEFPGLDSQIATGQVDADTNTAVPALDSDIKDFAYDDVGGTGRDIVEYLSMLEYYLHFNASRMGLDPVQFAVVMRPELWFELSAVWPCSYLSHRCATDSGSNPIVINDNVNVDMRDAMRNGMYIDINGNRYPVIVDDGIFEHNNVNNGNLALGEYASSIYMVPLTITGGFPVLYREHVDYRAARPDIAPLRGKENFWTDDGLYMWAFEDNNFCYKLKMKTEQRVVLRTPQLAGKIQSVKYSPLQHLRSPFPDSPYHFDGGVSMRGDETTYAVWK
jgi:hypothetical protein